MCIAVCRAYSVCSSPSLSLSFPLCCSLTSRLNKFLTFDAVAWVFLSLFSRILCRSVFKESSRLEQILFESSPFFLFSFSSLLFWRKIKIKINAECKKLRAYKILRDPESQLSIILRQVSSFSRQLSSILVKPNLIRSFDIERSFRKPHLVTADIFGVLFFTRHPRGRFFPPTSGIFKNPLKKREWEERKSDEWDDRWLFTISHDGRIVPMIREHRSINGLSIVLEMLKGRGDRS